MPPLPTNLRTQLEKATIAARDTAESAARAALITLAIERETPFTSMPEDQRRLRRGLRAKARQLGGGGQAAGIPLLIEEIAYAQWHRMLFARFLAENGLLMHDAGVAVTLAECAELATEEGATDTWELAARYASAMLPGLFPVDEPTVQVRFAREHQQALERLLDNLPPAVFTSDDGLGWVYQFWQSKRKDQVNASETKIGAGTIGPVTQLFTEDYMVKFLLHNSLGAWWAARHPDSPLLPEFEYLRWLDEMGVGDQGVGVGDQGVGVGDQGVGVGGQTLASSGAAVQSKIQNPKSKIAAAGTFPGWPDRAAEVTILDPCGGSGHFVVAEFDMLRKMRMEEEGLDAAAAGEAVIRDNLFMLEIDPRATQIATFNVLLAAWKAGGYRPLPVPHIACSGIAVEGQLDDWLRLAGDDVRLRTSLERLYHLFKNAPTLGSLIDPTHVPMNDRLFSADYADVAPLLERALQREQRADDPATAVLGEAAKGVLNAARLLGRKYALVATNVPYLNFVKQSKVLKQVGEAEYPRSKADLATMFLERCRNMTDVSGVYALVTPQNWLYLRSYKDLRNYTLRSQSWHSVSWLGPGAFETVSGEVVKPALVLISNQSPSLAHRFFGIDVTGLPTAHAKAYELVDSDYRSLLQADQILNPDYRIVLSAIDKGSLLLEYANSYQGICTGDYSRFGRCFWETPALLPGWIYEQSTVQRAVSFGGMEHVLLWQSGDGDLYTFLRQRLGESGLGAWIRGLEAWGSKGICVSQMGNLPVSLYSGDCFDNNAAVIIPKKKEFLPAIWTFCQSFEFSNSVRAIDKSLKVTNKTLLKVPFDLNTWQAVFDEQFLEALPEPFSNDPTQWLFTGHPAGASDPLQVAVARLLGYRWPDNGADGLDAFADKDGIVCLTAVAGEQPAAERLRALLAHAYTHPPTLPDFERYRVGDYVPSTPAPVDAGWSLPVQERLLAHAGYGGKTLDDWLRYGFFEQHCRLFHNRPFIWHVWDGKPDGFHALVNYHKLDAALLDKLIYTTLGAWISDQRAERDAGVPGADSRLVAALELQKKLVLIREGEPPYDIYVRWKPLHQQPVGWNPDLNDGVRLNSRPWVTAGVLRKKFTINWNKDRGKNPDGSERLNDLHFTRAQKQSSD